MLPVPKIIQSNARKGLLLHKQYNRGGTEVGLHTAKLLSSGKVSEVKVRHISKYFARHEGDNLNQKNPPSNGWIAWLLWGGWEGWEWSRNIVERNESMYGLYKDGKGLISKHKTKPSARAKFDKLTKGMYMGNNPYWIEKISPTSKKVKNPMAQYIVEGRSFNRLSDARKYAQKIAQETQSKVIVENLETGKTVARYPNGPKRKIKRRLTFEQRLRKELRASKRAQEIKELEAFKTPRTTNGFISCKAVNVLPSGKVLIKT